RIYSARFMGDRCYLVTFRQIDPFFVIDLSTPTEPEVLGYLKIEGFSGYLHPYDEDYVIGVGKQGSNLKLSLFDATNVSSPIEAAPPFIVSGDWSDSPVLMDHKAFLFDKAKQLLALPVSINHYEYYTKSYWQGAYVFDISLEQGFTFRGGITHQNNTSYEYGYQVQRILYIEDVLYTVSEAKVKMNDMETLQLLNEVEL
ncbi:MAG: beta-propeller domain-containing protein, partial [Candidatus Bathyarchaeota archaeon]|nr:beta-propeller domain-containing protein [Candidatus Bathyarchaeota archaeon]